jgi:hypothetical protein
MVQGAAYAKPTLGQKCAATKRKLAAKKFKALTTCDAKAVQKGVPVDQGCVSKAKLSFLNAWGKVEAKGGCITNSDATTIENKVDAEDGNLQTILQVTGTASKCTAGKFKDSGKKSSCKLACYAKAATLGTAVDTNCLSKCTVKFTAACSKDETKGDCHTSGNCTTVENSIDAFTADVADELPPATTTTTTSTTSTTTTLCAPADFDYGITAVVDATLRNWPGGSMSFGPASCGVIVAAPSGNISNLSGDTWAVSSKAGFGTCSLSPQLPSCNTVGAVASLLANGRPVCSNSSDVFASGPSTAHVFISCS